MADEGLSLAALVIDCGEPAVLALWWRRLVGGEVEMDADGDARLRALGLSIDFLRVPEGKQGKNRLHIDLRADDVAAATERARGLGATRAEDVYAGTAWSVLRDPEGNEFCILGPAS